MNRLRLQWLGRLSSSLSISLLTAAAFSACSSARYSGFGSGGGGGGGGGGGTGAGGGGSVIGAPPNGGGGIGSFTTLSTPGGDDSGIDFDASLAPPMENPTRKK